MAISNEIRLEVISLLRDGLSYQRIQLATGVSRTTVGNIARRYSLNDDTLTAELEARMIKNAYHCEKHRCWTSMKVVQNNVKLGFPKCLVCASLEFRKNKCTRLHGSKT